MAETPLTAYLRKAPEQSLYSLFGFEERDKNQKRAVLGGILQRCTDRRMLICRLESACLLMAVCRRACVRERKRVLLVKIKQASHIGDCLMRSGPRGAFVRRAESARSLAVVSKAALLHRAFHVRVEAARRAESACRLVDICRRVLAQGQFNSRVQSAWRVLAVCKRAGAAEILRQQHEILREEWFPRALTAASPLAFITDWRAQIDQDIEVDALRMYNDGLLHSRGPFLKHVHACCCHHQPRLS